LIHFVAEHDAKKSPSEKFFEFSALRGLKTPQKNNRIISYKFLKKLELMSLDFLTSSTDKIYSNLRLLEHTKDLNKLTLQHLVKEDRDLQLVYRVIKRCKYLTSLDFNTMNRAEKITDKGLFWLKRIFRLVKNVRSLSFSGLHQNMTEVSIYKTFSLLPKLEFLQKISLELSFNGRWMNNLSLLCSLLAACSKAKFISLNLKYYDIILDQTFVDFFTPLTKVPSLREVSIIFGAYNFNLVDPDSLAKSMHDFLEKSVSLEHFSLEMRLDQAILLDFPFEKAKNLKKLNICLKESRGLSDKNFSAFVHGLRRCANIQELTINLCKCANLSDNSVESLSQALLNLKQLRILELVLGSKIVANTTLSGRSIECLGESLGKLDSLQELGLVLSNISRVCDRDVAILMDRLKYLKNIRDLKLDLSLCKLTSQAFQSLQKTLSQLRTIETFELDLFSCHEISGMFLSILCSCLISEKETLANMQKLMINLTGTRIHKSESTLYYSNLKKFYPKSYISLYIK